MAALGSRRHASFVDELIQTCTEDNKGNALSKQNHCVTLNYFCLQNRIHPEQGTLRPLSDSGQLVLI